MGYPPQDEQPVFGPSNEFKDVVSVVLVVFAKFLWVKLRSNLVMYIKNHNFD